jgi:hypothetical protein
MERNFYYIIGVCAASRVAHRCDGRKTATCAMKKFLYGLGALCIPIAIVLMSGGCGVGSGLFRQYEYEEDIYVSLDGTATVYLNSSIAALDALRGVSFDTNPSSPVDREAIRAYFSTPNTHVSWVRSSRRNGRRFAHVRLEVDDIRKLTDAAPFAWSTYRFDRVGNVFVYQQTIGPSAGKNVGDVGWTGRELVAFRLHLPSKIEYHTRNPADPEGDNRRRGNILVWEQSLADRLRGTELTLDARMQTQSILYTTLWLFGATFVAVVIAFGSLIWWVLRRGASQAAEQV